MKTMRTTGLALLLSILASCAPNADPPRTDPVKVDAPKPAAPKDEMPLLGAPDKNAPVMERPVMERPQPGAAKPKESPDGGSRVKNPLGLSDEEWKKKLSAEEYYVCRQQGTERPFTGKLLNYHGNGTFICAACENPLFDPTTKFESGSGWPSFWKPLSKEAVAERGDLAHGMTRVEVTCSKCGSHLGHVFDDGPQPTGLRYCMNSVSLKIKEPEAEKK
jgi:peptide-methionine (R)-S-oxide reductase